VQVCQAAQVERNVSNRWNNVVLCRARYEDSGVLFTSRTDNSRTVRVSSVRHALRNGSAQKQQLVVLTCVADLGVVFQIAEVGHGHDALESADRPWPDCVSPSPGLAQRALPHTLVAVHRAVLLFKSKCGSFRSVLIAKAQQTWTQDAREHAIASKQQQFRLPAPARATNTGCDGKEENAS